MTHFVASRLALQLCSLGYVNTISDHAPPYSMNRRCNTRQPTIMSEEAAVVYPAALVFGLSASQVGRSINSAANAAGLGEGFTGHSGRVGMAQDLASTGVELPELMTAGRRKSSRSRPGRGAQILPGEQWLKPIFCPTTMVHYSAALDTGA